MRRFLEIALLALALAIALYFVLYRANVPLDIIPGEELSVPFRANETQLQVATENGYQDVRLRGVEVSSALPGHHFSDYAATVDDYARWLDQIDELGANTVVVTQLMDDEFYDALLEHNQSNDEPLLLVQGIMAEEELEQASANAYDSGLMDRLIKQGKVVVDAIHGQRDVSAVGIGGSGTYRSDVSTWVAALLVVDEFDVDNVAYTDHSTVRDGAYTGTYFSTSEEATVFEAMLAEVMDRVVAYETTKYDVQRPIGFTSSPQTDPLVFADSYARQIPKYVCVDAEHVVPTEQSSAGRLCAYRIAGVVDELPTRLADEWKQRHAEQLAVLDKQALYGGYLRLLAAYHSMPLIGLFSSSTARATADARVAPMNEQGQGKALCAVSEELDNARWSGTIVSSWQDVWERSSWNTKFAVYDTNTHLWHDLQTPTQCNGLLAFDPSAEPVCVLDGSDDEWEEEDVIARADATEDAAANGASDDGTTQAGAITVSARYDAEGLYLLVSGVTDQQSAFVPLDVSREVGVLSSTKPELSFKRDAEFVLCLEGPTNSRLLVLSRYDATRQRFLYDAEGIDPFVEIIPASDTTFVVERLAASTDTLLGEQEYAQNKHTAIGFYEAGILAHGNGNPSSDDYDSRADVCYGENCVEVRLPWLMLNVGDPSNMLAHRDYYDHYGVQFKKTSKIYMGVCAGGQTGEVAMEPLAVRGWKRVKYRERLKQSYAMVQDAWGGGA